MSDYDAPMPAEPDGGEAGPWDRLCHFLRAQSFLVLTHNPANARGSEYEAWAYRGPLDFEEASPVRFGLGADPASAMQALAGQLPEDSLPAATVALPVAGILLRVDHRELATILAALRFHQDENLQATGTIADTAAADVATDGGTIRPLNFAEVGRLCQRLSLAEPPRGLNIEPPEQESGDQPLFRVVYSIDLNADDPQAAASEARQIMLDPQSLPPVLEIIDYRGQVAVVDLSAR